MKIVMICGSPRKKGSTSQYLLDALREMLESENEICGYHALDKTVVPPLLEDLQGSDALVVACPLYVDSIPSNLLEVLTELENALPKTGAKTKVYLIVNNGFYDAAQNRIAIDMLWEWCDQCGFKKGCAIGAGAGEMIKMSPLGRGPSANIGRALRRFAGSIQEGRTE